MQLHRDAEHEWGGGGGGGLVGAGGGCGGRGEGGGGGGVGWFGGGGGSGGGGGGWRGGVRLVCACVFFPYVNPKITRDTVASSISKLLTVWKDDLASPSPGYPDTAATRYCYDLPTDPATP